MLIFIAIFICILDLDKSVYEIYFFAGQLGLNFLTTVPKFIFNEKLKF